MKLYTSTYISMFMKGIYKCKYIQVITKYLHFFEVVTKLVHKTPYQKSDSLCTRSPVPSNAGHSVSVITPPVLQSSTARVWSACVYVTHSGCPECPVDAVAAQWRSLRFREKFYTLLQSAPGKKTVVPLPQVDVRIVHYSDFTIPRLGQTMTTSTGVSAAC